MLFYENLEARLFKKLGYSKDQEGILKRYIRENESWHGHLQKTREAIINQAISKNKTKVAILGSGWLLDVPLQDLSTMFSEVWLFDAVHPAKIKQQTKNLPNIRFIEADISGFAKPVYEYVRQGKHRPPIESLSPNFQFDLAGFDYVVSCNLLNQLDIILLDYLKEHCKIPKHDEDCLRSKIQETHLSILPPSKTCLVTDIEEIWVNKHEEVIGQKTLLFAPIPQNQIFDTWIWNFDNHYSYNPHCNTMLKVIACEI